MDNEGQTTNPNDSFGRAHGFSVELTNGGQPLEGNEGAWLSVSHSGLKFKIEDVTTGEDDKQTKAIGRKDWGKISLAGHVTKERNAVKDIYMAMLKGEGGKIYRGITVNWLGPNEKPIHKVDFQDCFLIDWSVSELDSNAENVPCIEYSTWQVGYSLNFLKSEK